LFRQPKDPNLKPTNIASLIYIVTHHQQHRQLREKEEDVHLADEFTPPESYHCMYWRATSHDSFFSSHLQPSRQQQAMVALNLWRRKDWWGEEREIERKRKKLKLIVCWFFLVLQVVLVLTAGTGRRERSRYSRSLNFLFSSKVTRGPMHRQWRQHVEQMFYQHSCTSKIPQAMFLGSQHFFRLIWEFWKACFVNYKCLMCV